MNIIWTKKDCPFCVKAKKLLDENYYQYDIREIDGEFFCKQDMLNMVPSAKTVPQIFIDSEYVGGYTDLVEWLQEEELW